MGHNPPICCIYIYIPNQNKHQTAKVLSLTTNPNAMKCTLCKLFSKGPGQIRGLGSCLQTQNPRCFCQFEGQKNPRKSNFGLPQFSQIYTCATHRSWFAIPELMQFSCVAPPTMDRLDIHGEVCWGCIEVNDRRSSACAWFVNGRFTPNGKNYTTGWSAFYPKSYPFWGYGLKVHYYSDLNQPVEGYAAL